MEVGVVILLVIMDLCAIVLNVGVIVVILKTPHLVHNLTNSFVLNLCGADLLSTLVIVPIWITNFAAGAWILPSYVCDIYGFVYAALSYATIWTVCLISVERYYSIAYPMLHAANLTLPRTLVTMAFTWVFSGLLAVLPLLYDQKCASVYDVEGTICINVFADTVQGNMQWIVTGVLCFCIPTAIVALMYALIFNIARNAHRQIQPGNTVDSATVTEDKYTLPIVKEAIFSSTGKLSIIGSPLNAHAVDESLENFRKYSGKKRSFSKEFLQIFRMGKAARTVIGISGLFLGLWMPHFVVLFYGSLNPYMPAREEVESIATWLSFLTFIVNPLLYGIGNQPIRIELVAMFRRSPKVACVEEDGSSPIEGEDLDFMQFLERTSEESTSKRSSETANDRY